MTYSPAVTFAIYMTVISGLLCLVAAAADLWTAKAERDERRRLRDVTRATRRSKLETGETPATDRHRSIRHSPSSTRSTEGNNEGGRNPDPHVQGPVRLLTSLTQTRIERRCPSARQAIQFYRSRYSAWREERGISTSRPVGRRPGSCLDARWLAKVWKMRAANARVATENWLRLDERRSWQAAIREVQVAYPGTDGWLISCSRTEGAGRSLDAPFVMNHQGSGAGGWLQFMESTFWRMFAAAEADAERRGFDVPRTLASWSSRTGQALAGGWAARYGATHEWSGAGC